MKLNIIVVIAHGSFAALEMELESSALGISIPRTCPGYLQHILARAGHPCISCIRKMISNTVGSVPICTSLHFKLPFAAPVF